MDAKKTGAFIAQLRKEKQYTQKELAEKLHVSDKAISRWETGKGFPDTALLLPLAEILEISVGELLNGECIAVAEVRKQTDQVIVNSLKYSEKRESGFFLIAVVSALVTILICITLLLFRWDVKLSAVNFVNKSDTYQLYHLGEKQESFYEGYLKTEFETGYLYHSPDGSEQYFFTDRTSRSENPVMAYLHRSGEGRLFGIDIGEETVVEKNTTLGVSKKYSLWSYLEDNGFKWQHDPEVYGRPSLVYIEGVRCNWFSFVKDNVFINICISAWEGRPLYGFDIGLIEDGVMEYLNQTMKGHSVTLEDPYGVVTSKLESTYQQWDSITITAGQLPEGCEALSLYINGEFQGKFDLLPRPPFSSEYEITFEMWNIPITVEVTAKKPADE